MAIQAPQGAFATAVLAAGGGLAVYLPEERWIGLATIGIAVLLFLFQITVDHKALKARWGMFGSAFILVGFIFIAIGAWAVWHGFAVHDASPPALPAATANKPASFGGHSVERLMKWLEAHGRPEVVIGGTYTVAELMDDLNAIADGMWNDGIDAMGEDA